MIWFESIESLFFVDTKLNLRGENLIINIGLMHYLELSIKSKIKNQKSKIKN